MTNEIKGSKVREVYDLGKQLILVASDKISLFDVVLEDEIPRKGIYLTKMQLFWFEYTSQFVNNYVISGFNVEMPEEFHTDEFKGRCLMVQKLDMLPVECIVAGYLTGSVYDSYLKDGEVGDIKLPKGLKASEKLPETIFLPVIKKDNGQYQEIISYNKMEKLIGNKWASQMREYSLNIYSKALAYAQRCGIIIGDTKLKFGVSPKGDLVLAGNLLTPDTSRFWIKDDYQVGKEQESYDKQFLRHYLEENGWDKKSPAPRLPNEIIQTMSNRYIRTYEMMIKINVC